MDGCHGMLKGTFRKKVDHDIPDSAGLPEREVILSRRDEPPALILASRRSRRMRACFWVGDSSLVAGLAVGCGSIVGKRIHDLIEKTEVSGWFVWRLRTGMLCRLWVVP